MVGLKRVKKVYDELLLFYVYRGFWLINPFLNMY